jgi:uncharacterized protein
MISYFCSYNSVVYWVDVQEFEWDEVKARINRKKHGIDFEEAVKVFLDEFALTEIDQFIEGEVRWQTIGMLGDNAILVVAHTIKEEETVEIVRIISARRTVPSERRRYEQNRSQNSR